jgi:hypothetical protein
MGQVLNIREFPLLEDVIITVFQSSPKSEIGISRDGTVISQKHFAQSEFNNARKIYRNHQLLGNFHQEKFSGKLEKFLSKIGYPLDPGSGAVSTLRKYLETQGYPRDSYPNLTTWIIVPKPDKSYTGTPFNNVFKDLPDESFLPGRSNDYTLPVYMTKITPQITEIKFRVDIPKHIYKKCMGDSDPDARPQTNYIESNSLSELHKQISIYSSQALRIADLARSSEKSRKMIGIVFNSKENSVRDNFNFAYLGQKITTSFNWYTIYEYQDNSLLGGKKYYAWKKMMSGHNLSSLKEFEGMKGIVDLETKGQKSHLINKPEGILVEWTQEREDFLSTLEGKFRTLSSNLNEFLSDLDSEKLDLLIGNSSLNLLN